MKVGTKVVHPNTQKLGKVVNSIKISPRDHNYNSTHKLLVSWDDKLPFMPNNPDKMIKLEDETWISLEDSAYRRYKDNGGTWVLSSFLIKA